MDITGTINAEMSKMARSMRNGIDNCKTDGKIAEKQKLIKSLTREIGNLAYETIKAAKEEISVLESEKKKSTIICQECGSKTSVDMKYCGKCGTCLQEA